jgi:hypothetical protein
MVKPSTNTLKVKLDLAQRLRRRLVRMLIGTKLARGRRQRIQERIEVLDCEIASLQAKLTPNAST